MSLSFSLYAIICTVTLLGYDACEGRPAVCLVVYVSRARLSCVFVSFCAVRAGNNYNCTDEKVAVEYCCSLDRTQRQRLFVERGGGGVEGAAALSHVFLRCVIFFCSNVTVCVVSLVSSYLDCFLILVVLCVVEIHAVILLWWPRFVPESMRLCSCFCYTCVAVSFVEFAVSTHGLKRYARVVEITPGFFIRALLCALHTCRCDMICLRPCVVCGCVRVVYTLIGLSSFIFRKKLVVLV